MAFKNQTATRLSGTVQWPQRRRPPARWTQPKCGPGTGVGAPIVGPEIIEGQWRELPSARGQKANFLAGCAVVMFLAMIVIGSVLYFMHDLILEALAAAAAEALPKIFTVGMELLAGLLFAIILGWILGLGGPSGGC